jgi:hypothetical protein
MVGEARRDFVRAVVLILEAVVVGILEATLPCWSVHPEHAVLGNKCIVEAQVAIGVRGLSSSNPLLA